MRAVQCEPRTPWREVRLRAVRHPHSVSHPSVQLCAGRGSSLGTGLAGQLTRNSWVVSEVNSY